jgi:hypothetical protein
MEESMRRVNTSKIVIFILLTATVLFAVPYSHSGVPQLINYQGKLTNSSGTPVPDGNHDVEFKIYDVASGGSALWTETWNSSTSQVVTKGGIFTAMLGTHQTLPLTFFSDHQVTYLGITVGADSEMTPRQKITSVGYAFSSEIAGNGVPRGFIGMWSGSADQIPAGWALCDGNNGTPDLRDRFIVGAGSGYSVGQTGGLALNNIQHLHDAPIHNHSIQGHTHSMNDHVHTVALGAIPGEGSNNGYVTVDWKDVADGSKNAIGQHYHPTYVSGPSLNTTGEATGNTGNNTSAQTGLGGTNSLENRPPYYALAFIMKL